MPLTKVRTLGITDGAIVAADIADGTITAAKFAAGAVSSDYVLLASTTASSSASISFDGYFSSTYKNYKIIISDLTFSVDSVLFKTRFRKSNADITTSHYSQQGAYSDGYSFTVTSGTDGNDQSTRIYSDFMSLRTSVNLIRGMNVSDNSSWVTSLTVDIYDPLGTNNNKTAIAQYFTRGNNTYNTLQVGQTGFVLSDATTAISGITFFPASGNMPRGNFKLYGIK